ncbi:DUF1269 domain-containing protein [Listeria monocytogenes]|nr:DUF1269 domain-containing protein [Listeria monocytogenes]EAC2457477.1 DUF1269 domain-containing protein [Listeria monocytogenes]EAC5672945.1 DUF1269 domain-containing protein [Listeria monocytogenes]EAC7920224.1 DUF1269 domain-containing protein [Listeria monocytogenes]EAE0929224.1 DUF1269 domain-containing protein [Listeria monocytogenes]
MKKEKTVLIMNFDEESISYQAFSEMKRLHQERKIIGYQMAVVKHEPGNKLVAQDFLDFTGADKNMKDSLIGMLIGWMVGAIVGSMRDAGEVKDALTVFERTLKTIPEGSTGVILIATEQELANVNDVAMDELHGRVQRMDEAIVAQEIKSAQETEGKAKDSAKKHWFSK